MLFQPVVMSAEAAQVAHARRAVWIGNAVVEVAPAGGATTTREAAGLVASAHVLGHRVWRSVGTSVDMGQTTGDRIGKDALPGGVCGDASSKSGGIGPYPGSSPG